MKNWAFQLFFWLFLMAILWGPSIENRMEAEDAYAYAFWAEKLEYEELLHPHHPLYHPFSKWIYEISGAERALPVLSVVSGMFSSLALWLFYQLLRRLGVQKSGHRMGYTLLLTVTYGFWRYAREVEVYALGWLALLLVLHAALAVWDRQDWKPWLALIIAVVFACGVHKAFLPPLSVIVGLLLFRERNLKRSILLLLSFVTFYGLCELGYREMRVVESNSASEIGQGELGHRLRENSKPRMKISWQIFPKAAIGLGACGIGSFPVMGWDLLYNALQNQMFPYRNFDEERFLVKNLSPFRQSIWLFGLCGLGAIVLGMLQKFFRTNTKVIVPRLSLGILLWCAAGVFAGLIMLFEPGNPEMWLLGLPLFWLVVAVSFPSPSAKVLTTGVGCLMMTNWVGGMSLLGNPERNYDIVTGNLTLNDFGPKDLYIIVPESDVHGRYVNYETGGEVLLVSSKGKDEVWLMCKMRESLQDGHRVVIHSKAVLEKVLNLDHLNNEGLKGVLDTQSRAWEIFLK